MRPARPAIVRARAAAAPIACARSAPLLAFSLVLLGGHASLLAQSAGITSPATASSTLSSAALTAGQVGLDTTITVIQGHSRVIDHPVAFERVSIADPEVADAVVVSAREVVLNGKTPGTTSLLIWDASGRRAQYTIFVTADGAGLHRVLQELFPDETIRVRASRQMLILSGVVTDPQTATRALQVASTWSEGVQIMDDIEVPQRGQVLLRVRFAEVNRSALRDLGVNLLHIDPDDPRGDDEAVSSADGVVPPTGTFIDPQSRGPEQTFSDAVNFFLFHRSSNMAALIEALKTRGLFKSLAEPNLLAVPGEQASFLAGGEFPFPVLQGGATNAVTIQFKEFGIRLNFLPTLTNSGAIRLHVAPEVSSLDFANALQAQGFQIPALLSRRAETVIELESGQTFAIAGLIDSSLQKTVNKIPVLGDIPVLGALFRSENMRQNRSELLVLVTPQIVHPLDTPPPVPTGEPEEWPFDRAIRDSMQMLPPFDSTSAPQGQDGG